MVRSKPVFRRHSVMPPLIVPFNTYPVIEVQKRQSPALFRRNLEFGRMPTGTYGFYCKELMELFEEEALDWLPARAARSPPPHKVI
jgi:hypothetical protein